MINVNKLRGKIVENGYTQEELAKYLEITPKTLTSKMKKGVFTNIEIEKIVEFLKIDNLLDIFFV